MTNNNLIMLDQVKVENERVKTKKSEQLQRLLANKSSPCLMKQSSQIKLDDHDRNRLRRRSEASLFGSFNQRMRLSIGSTFKDAPNAHVFSRYRQSRFNARRIRKRVVFKHGDCNVVQGNVAKRRRKYLQDIFTTLVDAQWRWTLLVFALNFILSWLLFAIVWWLIVFTHGDLVEEHLNGTEPWTPCITNIQGFTSCFLFSVETQHTIGYGGRTTTEECPEAIFVMCLQSIAGVMIQAFMVGIVFAKLSRPQKRTQTLLFSRNAVISHRDGIPCLMFRVGDMRKSHIIEAHVRAQLIKHKVTKEGESLPFFQTELKVGGDGEEDKIFFIWPTTIVHKIDRNSPLYNMSATDLLRERFEIVVILEGVIESTGMTTQARSSYLPSEILWGHRFQSLISFKKDSGEYEVDYALFNNTVEVDTPLCSARELDEHRAMFSNECLDDKHQYLTITGNNFHAGLFPSVRTHSSDTLCSMDSFSDDGHIEMKIPSPIPVTVTGPDPIDDEMLPLRPNGVVKHFEENDNCNPTKIRKLKRVFFHLQLNANKNMSSSMYNGEKLFYRPGVIEELEEDNDQENQNNNQCDASPLMLRNKLLVDNFRQNSGQSLARISTCNSTISQIGNNPNPKDSNRKSFRPNATRKIRRRAVFKNGDCNILQSQISRRRLRFLQDIFTTLVDTQWRWTLTIFAIGFVGSWLIFALIWWLIAFTHGDLEPDHLPAQQSESGWIPCVLNIHGFTSSFLFSIETQHTIGYGVRTTTEECPEAIFIMCLQSIAGMMIQAFMVGIVFAKMTRPKLRTQTLLFSKNAVICQREGRLSMMFRVGDMRKSHIIGASIRAQLIRAKKTKEGEILNNYQTELTVNADGCDGNLFFIWPMTIVHKIDEDSPFYHLSASDLLQERFEVVVILEGTIESTGQTTQARSSYLASEVLWGNRFEPVVSYNKDRQGYEVNYSKFNNIIPVDTPLCSGAELDEFYKMQQEVTLDANNCHLTPMPALLEKPNSLILAP